MADPKTAEKPCPAGPDAVFCNCGERMLELPTLPSGRGPRTWRCPVCSSTTSH